jgi:hypothetical protein
MAVAPLLTLAAETGGIHDVNPWFVGAGIMLLFIVLMLGLLAFGAGRDHS